MGCRGLPYNLKAPSTTGSNPLVSHKTKGSVTYDLNNLHYHKVLRMSDNSSSYKKIARKQDVRSLSPAIP